MNYNILTIIIAIIFNIFHKQIEKKFLRLNICTLNSPNYHYGQEISPLIFVDLFANQIQ
jgi:hypothetical protein